MDEARTGQEREPEVGTGHATSVLHPRLTLQIVAAVTLAALVVAGLWLLWIAAELLLLVFAGLLVAVFLRGLSDLLSEHTPLTERWALLVVVLTILGALAAGIVLAGPTIVAQVDQLLQELPQALERVEAWLDRYAWGRALLERLPAPLELAPRRMSLISQLTGTVSDLLSIIGNIVLILAIGLYLAFDPAAYQNGLIRLVPPRRRARAREVLHSVSVTLRYWVLGRGIAILVDSLLTAVGLWFLGMPLIPVLTAVEAVMILVPFIGPLLGALPAVLIAWLRDPSLALSVALLFLAIELLETYVVTPLIQQRAVELPPALVLSTAVLLGVLFGGLGVLLATPLTAAIVVVVKMLYVEDFLGDTSIQVTGEDESVDSSS